jgi:ADP-heptose:LPS heptosyltransferase
MATMAVARIIKEIGAPVVLMGGPSEKEVSMCEAIKEHVTLANGSRDGLHIAIPAAGTEKSWPLRTSLAFALQCDLVITPDTGMWWATAFEPMPKVLMISHASVENIAKHAVNTTVLHADPNNVPCWPCHRLHDDISTCVPNKFNNGAACISDISVESLLTAVRKSWEKPLAEAA